MSIRLRQPAEQGIGLVGRSAPGFGVPRLPDGTALPKPFDRHETYALLYERFADAWRVTDATTLFDYESGRTTASYTIAELSDASKVATFQDLDPAKVDAGPRGLCCRDRSSTLRDQCAYDVAVTGDAGYVGAVRRRRARHGAGDRRFRPARARRRASPEPTEPTANPPVEVLPVLHRLAGSALAPDGTLYLSVVMADRTGRVLAIDPHHRRRSSGRLTTTGAGEVAVAAGSVWVGEFTAPTTGGVPDLLGHPVGPATLTVQATIPTACHRVWLRTNLACHRR